jgi:hypothetical protein|eukprot:COSAG01_NODE_10988_length_2032_cov_1.302638_3_plen_149_part_00
MVPQFQPKRALDLFSRWIGVQDVAPVLVPPASKPQLRSPPQPTSTAEGESAPKRNPIGASRAADEVKSLPGWDGPLPSRMFSGYLDIGLSTGATKDIHIHYWLTESEGNPSRDPVSNGPEPHLLLHMILFISVIRGTNMDLLARLCFG